MHTSNIYKLKKIRIINFIFFFIFISSCQGESSPGKEKVATVDESVEIEISTGVKDPVEGNINAPYFSVNTVGFYLNDNEMYNSTLRDDQQICILYKHANDVENDAIGRDLIVRAFSQLNQQERLFEDLGENRMYCKNIPIGANIFAIGFEVDDTRGLTNEAYIEVYIHPDELPQYLGEFELHIVNSKGETFLEPDWEIFSGLIDENSSDLEGDDFFSVCFYRDPANLLESKNHEFVLADWVSKENNGEKFFISCQFFSRGKIGPVFDVHTYTVELL